MYKKLHRLNFGEKRRSRFWLEKIAKFAVEALVLHTSNSYFPAVIKEWNRFDIDFRKSESISIFKKNVC